MTQIYTLRDENGVMRAKVPEALARQIVAQDDGHWDDYRSKEQPGITRRVVRVTSDCSIILKPSQTASESVQLFFWKDCTLIPE